MKAYQARRFLERIYHTRDEELDCAGLMEVIDRYVELEALGREASAIAPGVPHHLNQCPDCAELVAVLKRLVVLEEAGELPAVDELWEELRQATSARPAAAASSGPLHTARLLSAARQATLRSLASRLRSPAWSVAAIVIVVLAAGWWHSARQSRLVAEIVATMGQSDTIRNVELPNNARARVFFADGDRKAVVYVGNLSHPQGQKWHCWLKDEAGTAVSANAHHYHRGAEHWWLVRADRPIGSYSSFAMTLEPGGDPVFEVALR